MMALSSSVFLVDIETQSWSVDDNMIVFKKGCIALMLVVLEKKTELTFHKPLDS